MNDTKQRLHSKMRLGSKPREKISLVAKPSRKRHGNIKLNFKKKKMQRASVDWIGQTRGLVNSVLSLRVPYKAGNLQSAA